MSILITGATGFIGSNLAKQLSRQHKVYGTGRPGENKVACELVADIPWNSIDTVFHLQAITDTTNLDTLQMMQTNVYDSLELFRQAREHKVERIVYASSCAVYGDGPFPYHEEQPLRPMNPYAESKALLDKLAAPFEVIGLRFSNVYGPGEQHKGGSASMVYQIFQAMQQGQRPKLFKYGEQGRDFISVEEVCRGCILAAEKGKPGIYNIGSGITTTFNQLVQSVNKQLGTTLEAEFIDNPYQEAYQDWTEVDISKARRELGY